MLYSKSEVAGRTAAAIVDSLRERETQLQNDNYNLRQKIINLETRVNQQLSENLTLKHQVLYCRSALYSLVCYAYQIMNVLAKSFSKGFSNNYNRYVYNRLCGSCVLTDSGLRLSL